MGFFIGLDLGQAADYSALAVLERIIPQAPAPASYGTHELWRDGQPIAPPRTPLPPVYHGRHLERFPLGTPYPKIIEGVTARLATPALQGATLILDATGVGRPVVDMFRAAGLKPVPVTITGGEAVTRTDDGYWHVPKRDLVGAVQVLLQSARLKFAAELPLVQTLTQELLNFKVKISAQTAHDSYGSWRENEHDDLVLAVALAAWYAGRKPQRVHADYDAYSSISIW